MIPVPAMASRDDGDADEGTASVELVLAAPLLGLLLMLIVQFALWAHAVHLAQAAANGGVQAARAYGSTTEAGRREATTLAQHLAGTVLTGTHVTCERGATSATVTVTGNAITVIPGLHLPVRARVTAPLERAGSAP